MSTEVTNIINQLPNILVYFVEGYIFLLMYKYSSYKDKRIEPTSMSVFVCVVISFVIKVVVDFILDLMSINICNNAYYLVLIIAACVFGYIVGRVLRTKIVVNILTKIGIHRSPSDSIWAEVISNKYATWVSLKPHGSDLYYQGVIYRAEENEREPIIALRNYRILNSDKKEISPTEKSDDVMLINTKDFDVIELVYEDGRKSNG